jgi:hypothetical protein
MPDAQNASAPMVVAVEMGYGHLRAALPIAESLGVALLAADREPLAGPDEKALWDRVRATYEITSRLSQVPIAGGPLRLLLDRFTDIPSLYSGRDLSAPTSTALWIDRLAGRGLGRGMVETLRESGRPLVTTFFVPAVVADRAGLENPVFCVATDTDVNRAWAPVEASRTRIRYLVPTRRVAKRLAQYGVPEARITFTGFPLPRELLGGPGLPALKRNLAGRLVRLDPRRAFRGETGGDVAAFLGPLPVDEEGRPPLLTFAVGGAGAQANLARRFLPSLRPSILEGRLRVALVAGAKAAVRDVLQESVAGARLEAALGNGLEILFEANLAGYFRRFNQLLAATDVLWTKPSELTFFAALGLPMICAPPVGVHERRNRRWVRESGAGMKQREPAFAAEWLADMLADGQLAAAAWAGYVRLPKNGLYRILEEVGGLGASPSEPRESAASR